MAHLRTRNLFIDTESFDAANLNFESTALKELVCLVETGFAKVFLTTITVAEIQSHIKDGMSEVAQGLNRARGKLRLLRNLSEYKSIFAEFDEHAAIAELQRKLDAFLTKADVTVLDLEHAEAEVIFKDYFSKKPPFGENKNKREFPDAFAQHVLKKWCETHNCEMYVVSADADWQCVGGKLIPLARLREFIDAAVKDEAAELSEKALRLYKKSTNKIEAVVTEAFKDCGFYTVDVDGDVNDVRVTGIKLGEPLVLEVDEGSATISVDVDLDYIADVSYLDDDEGIWDSEDHQWSYRPTRYEEVEESENFEAELFVQFDPDNDDSFDVSCTIGKDFQVTVLPTDYELK